MAQGSNQGASSFYRHSTLKLVVKVSIIAVFITGSLTLMEWISGISVKSFFLEYQQMRLITSILLVLSSVSLWLFIKGSSWSKPFLRIAGIITIFFSVITLLTFYPGVESNQHYYFLFDFLHPDNKMAMFTALIFLCLGFIFILFSNDRQIQDDIGHILFFPAASLSYFVFISYFLQIPEAFMVEGIFTAPDTAFSLFLLCLVVLFIRPGTWLMKILSGQGPGSIMGRKLLPWIISVPVIISWMRITADQQGYFPHEIGAILASIIYIVSFLFLVWYSALSVNKMDETRQQAFEALHESEIRLNALVTATTDVVYIMSPDWKQMYSLEGGNFLTSVKEPESDWFNNFIPRESQPHVWEVIQKSIDEKSKFELEHEVISIDGSIGWTFSRAIPILNNEGEIKEWIGIAEDITELKKAHETLLTKERNEAMRIGAENALLKLNEELTRSNKELQQFVYLTSHDLQEPLRTISNFSDRLFKKYKDHFDEEGEQLLHYIVQGSIRMKKLINALLTYSMIGSSTSEFTEVDFNLVFNNVVDDLAPVILKKNAIVTSSELPWITGDEGQLFHLLKNLIDNSLKFCKKTPEIHVSAREELDHYLFSVKDNGIGINERYSEKIFLIFQRLVSRREYEGTGIGLSICKRVVERHGGKIYFESKIRDGTTFFFTIPKDNN